MSCLFWNLARNEHSCVSNKRADATRPKLAAVHDLERGRITRTTKAATNRGRMATPKKPCTRTQSRTTWTRGVETAALVSMSTFPRPTHESYMACTRLARAQRATTFPGSRAACKLFKPTRHPPSAQEKQAHLTLPSILLFLFSTSHPCRRVDGSGCV